MTYILYLITLFAFIVSLIAAVYYFQKYNKIRNRLPDIDGEVHRQRNSSEKMIEELRQRHERRHGLPGRSYQLGPQQQPLAAYVRHELLRYRIYGGRCRTLRFCPLRV